MGEALSEFRPEALTASRVAQLATLVFPDRLGTAIWVNLKSGQPDEGVTVELFKKDKITADVLVGHASLGAALGYQVAQRGNLTVSVMAGVAHPWTTTFSRGWQPVLGMRIRL